MSNKTKKISLFKRALIRSATNCGAMNAINVRPLIVSQLQQLLLKLFEVQQILSSDEKYETLRHELRLWWLDNVQGEDVPIGAIATLEELNDIYIIQVKTQSKTLIKTINIIKKSNDIFEELNLRDIESSLLKFGGVVATPRSSAGVRSDHEI